MRDPQPLGAERVGNVRCLKTCLFDIRGFQVGPRVLGIVPFMVFVPETIGFQAGPRALLGSGSYMPSLEVVLSSLSWSCVRTGRKLIISGKSISGALEPKWSGWPCSATTRVFVYKGIKVCIHPTHAVGVAVPVPK